MAKKPLVTLDDFLIDRFPKLTWAERAQRLHLTAKGLWDLRHGLRQPRGTTLAVLAAALRFRGPDAHERVKAAIAASGKRSKGG